MNLAIFGAQAIAFGTYEAIRNLYPKREISCFLVSEYGNNPTQLAGVPVCELKSYAEKVSQEEKKSIEILIATPENVMLEIETLLDAYGFFCHVRLTSSRFAQLMSFYNVKADSQMKYMPLSVLPIGYHKANLQVYMAKFYRDKPLLEAYPMPEWMTSIQVGAALCDERVAEVLDSDGEHISDKNVNYSELTALYWMWKNRLLFKSKDETTEFYGLSHYRRILDLSEDDILRLADNEVDVVLPYPMPYEPTMEEHHKRYLSDTDWDAVLRALQELQPEYAVCLSEVLEQKYLYNYNIIVARKEVLAEYCCWLFPILERVEELSEPKGCKRADRYMGYIAESLETIYFMLNKNRLHIVHTGCRFLI